MSPIRLVSRWLLTLLALILALLAVLTLMLRLLPVLLEQQAPQLERLLSARFNAVVELDAVTAGLRHLDPHLAIDGL